VRRGTLITLVVLFVVLAVVAAVQLRQVTPSNRYPGPSGSSILPSGLTTRPPSTPSSTPPG